VDDGTGPETFSVEPGRTVQRTLPPGTARAVVTLNGLDTSYSFTPPDTCPSGQPALVASATLPVTGVNPRIVAFGAVVLITAGVSLFVLTRRRRLRFTV